MPEYYQMRCTECEPKAHQPEDAECYRQGRVPSEMQARMHAQTHDRKEHDGEETAEVVEA